MKVVSIARMPPLEHSAIIFTCIKRSIIIIENQFSVFLRVTVLHRFNCIHHQGYAMATFCSADVDSSIHFKA